VKRLASEGKECDERINDRHFSGIDAGPIHHLDVEPGAQQRRHRADPDRLSLDGPPTAFNHKDSKGSYMKRSLFIVLNGLLLGPSLIGCAYPAMDAVSGSQQTVNNTGVYQGGDAASTATADGDGTTINGDVSSRRFGLIDWCEIERALCASVVDAPVGPPYPSPLPMPPIVAAPPLPQASAGGPPVAATPSAEDGSEKPNTPDNDAAGSIDLSSQASDIDPNEITSGAVLNRVQFGNRSSAP
jgi:hypothetical protein